MSQSDDEKKKKKKKDEDWLMAQINAILEKSLKAALDQAIDDVLKDWR